MIILTIRTEKPEAEIALYDGQTELVTEIWQAHRQLAETLHTKIKELIVAQGKELQDIQAIACFQGPGSFTGLRIGLTVGNAMAYSLQIPIVAQLGENWKSVAITRLENGESDTVAMPEYGAEANITRPKS